MQKIQRVFLKKIPLPLKIKKPVLALGSQTKNTICFGQGNFAYLSPVHQDLSRPDDLDSFEKDANYCLKKRPKVIACDLHPEYQSTKFAIGLSAKRYTLYAIQHHHAHIASCMAENGLKDQPVIGVAFDGTGLGTDQALWGGEFFLASYRDCQRRAHLKEIPLLGQEQAILEPWRLTAAWLYQIYQDRFLQLAVDFTKTIDKKKWRVLKKIYLSGFNSPLSSSMGRLFDAVASLVLAEGRISSEAELAITLERLAARPALPLASYTLRIFKENGNYILDPSIIFKEIIRDLRKGIPKGKIAYRFHLTAAEMIRRMCLVLRRETRINRVALSGGVFQNKLLLRLSLALLYREGFEVFLQQQLSCNDSGISLGQVMIANARS